MKILGLGLYIVSSIAAAVPLAGLTDIDGNPATLKHEKNTELVVFWATWCPDCRTKLRTELPQLNNRSDVAVVTVNTDKSERRAKDYVERNEIKLAVVRDEAKTLRKALKVFSVPHWAVYKRANTTADWKLIDSAPAYESERVLKALGKS